LVEETVADSLSPGKDALGKDALGKDAVFGSAPLALPAGSP